MFNLYKPFVLASLFTSSAMVYAEQVNAPVTPVPEVSVAKVVALDASDPYILLDGVAKNVFKRFSNDVEIIHAKPDHLKDIIIDEMLPYIDYKYASFKVLGNKHLKKMTKEQRRSFIIAFKNYMVTLFAQVFTNYRTTQTVEVEPPKSVEGKKVVVVKSKIIEPGRPDIDIFFKLKKNRKTGQWYAFDMDAEGISMLNTKRKEIGAAIKRVGVEKVIDDLREKSQQSLILTNGAEKNGD